MLYHAVGQAALAVEVRSADAETKRIVANLTHWETEWRCRAERACLRVLEGGCSVPVGTETVLVPNAVGVGAVLTMTGTVTSLAGDRHVQQTRSGMVESAAEAEMLGEVVARVLIATGGREILDEVAVDRASRQAMGDKVLEPVPQAQTT